MNVALPSDPARVQRNIRSLVMWRFIFGALMIALPFGAHALFERQARRLDALADHGAPATATVTSATREYTGYVYAIDGSTYDWNVGRHTAPYSVGSTFPIIYLPETPSFSRPGSDRKVAIDEAASGRTFDLHTEIITFLFFGINMIACHFGLRRLRSTGQTERDDAIAYRSRLMFGGLSLSSLIVPMIIFSLQDAARRGESIWIVVTGFGLALAVVVGTGFYLLREGRANVAARSARIAKWAIPLAIGIAAIRIVAALLNK